jgi:hypothetical protein
MRDDSPGNDMRTIWQNQPTEPSVMTLDKIRRKTQELRAKTRHTLLGGIAVSLIMVAISGYGIASGDGLVVRAVFGFAIAWSLAGQYFVNRGMRPATLPEDAALSTSLESYRREVERQRYLSGRFLLWSLGPVVLPIATLIVLLLSFLINRGMLPEQALLKMIPFLTVLAIWVVCVFVIRIRHQRELQREIDELNNTERENKR